MTTNETALAVTLRSAPGDLTEWHLTAKTRVICPGCGEESLEAWNFGSLASWVRNHARWCDGEHFSRPASTPLPFLPYDPNGDTR